MVRPPFVLSLAVLMMQGACATDRQPPEPTLRVVTYNIHHGEGRDGAFDYLRLSRVLQGLRPDLVALQEVDRKTRRASGVDQAERLGALTGLESVFGRAMDFQGGEYGVALLSRFPVQETHVFSLPGAAGFEPRVALAARVVPDNGLPELTVVSTHLSYEDETLRLGQVRELDRLFGGGRVVIVMGDFNGLRSSPPMLELLRRQWLDVTDENSWIDYVLVRSEEPWSLIDTELFDDRVTSDHPALLSVLRWGGAGVRVLSPR